MRKRGLYLSLIPILPIAFYLFYPLTSDTFSYSSDRQLLEQKRAFLTVNTAPDSVEQPNVLWIIVDDLGYFDTDLYGDGLVAAPNIQRLANAGVLFTDAYATSPICSPSRAAMFTGRYNQRFGFEHQLHERYLRNRMEYYGFKYVLDSDPWVPEYQDEVPDEAFMSRMGLSESEITVAELLQDQGYQTGLMGKWHVSKHPDQSPQQFGFDQFYGFYASHSLYSPEGTSGIVDMKNDRDWTDDYIWSGQREGLHAIERNGVVIDEQRYLTKAITDESIRFIDDSAQAPFFLVASYNAPHTPFQVPQSYYDQFSDVNDPVERIYQAMIRCLDDEIGRLLTHLEEKGKLKNTLVLFVSDNGGAAYTHATDNGGLKGGKITNFEGGVRVPMILSWKGRNAGGLYKHPVSLTDLFTTTAAAANVVLPDREYDGVDLLEKIETNDPAHDFIYFRKGYNHAIRSATHKLIWNSRTQKDTLLYAISDDLYEKNNQYGSSGEVMNEMLDNYQQWNESLTPPNWPSVIGFNYVDEDGTVFMFEN